MRPSPSRWRRRTLLLPPHACRCGAISRAARTCSCRCRWCSCSAAARLRGGVADEGGWWPEFGSNEEALERMVQAIERANFRPGEDVGIAIDVAASQFGSAGRYRLAADNEDLDTQGFVARLSQWCGRYPIVSVEDPVAEDDDAGMQMFTRGVGDRVQVIGDDYLVTNAERVRAAAAGEACNGGLL